MLWRDPRSFHAPRALAYERRADPQRCGVRQRRRPDRQGPGRSMGQSRRLPARLTPLTAAAESAAAAARTRGHRTRLVDREAAPAHLVLVQLADRAARAFLVVHFDERESARLAGRPVANDIDGTDLTGRLEQRLQIGLGDFVRQVADVQLGAHDYSGIAKMP